MIKKKFTNYVLQLTCALLIGLTPSILITYLHNLYIYNRISYVHLYISDAPIWKFKIDHLKLKIPIIDYY